MAVHVAILRGHYVKLILEGQKVTEARLTKTRLAPYCRVIPGERIYFKRSGGPFMATAVADQVVFQDNLSPRKVARLKKQFNDAVCGDDAYWQMKRDSRYATFITLREVQPIDRGPTLAPSRGIAWFVLDEPEVGIQT